MNIICIPNIKVQTMNKNVNGKILIQYNFIYDGTKELYASPWVIRFGFEVKKSEL
jgi:hypothetical protein